MGVAASLAACSGNRVDRTGPKEGAGTVLSAVGGALIGSQIVGSDGRIATLLAESALAGLIGDKIVSTLEAEDIRRAYAAQVDALNRGASGAPVGWRNPATGRRGTIVPGPVYDSQGARCRAFTHTVYTDNRPQIARGTACRGDDGAWNLLN